LPVLQRYSSSDYGSPEAIVKKTLDTIYRSHFYETDESTGENKLKQDYEELRAEIASSLNQNVNIQLKDQLGKYLPNISSVGGKYSIDFTRGLNLAGIMVEFSDGSKKSIDQLGEGQKKKATLAILEWDEAVSKEIEDRTVIKAYDEPDANLDYTAQRNLFSIISKDTRDNASHVMAIVCTHSLALIDRAPAGSINRIAVRDGHAAVEYLNNNDDADIKEFLSQVAEISGFRNSSIFYEKAFFIVEGESEEASIGLLYKTYTGRSLAEDGVVLINLQTNGQWSNALKFLSANKANYTVLLLDSDTQYANSVNKVTFQKLQNIGFSTSFLTTNCFFIGQKEFEDTYSDIDLAAMSNSKYPKRDGTPWIATDFSALRSADKFSSELCKKISSEHGRHLKKPEIAFEMTKILDRQKIENNTSLRDSFKRLNEIVSL